MESNHATPTWLVVSVEFDESCRAVWASECFHTVVVVEWDHFGRVDTRAASVAFVAVFVRVCAAVFALDVVACDACDFLNPCFVGSLLCFHITTV